MTRKDYVLLAAALHRTKPEVNCDLTAQWEIDVRAIATALANTNPRFDRARFLEACGVSSCFTP